MTDDGRVRRALAGDTSLQFTRHVALDDIKIRGKTGEDGRTVIAYALVFDSPSEIRDTDGHYEEQNARTAVDQTLAARGPQGTGSIFSVYNHGRTLQGTPSDMGSVPVGVPSVMKADGRGLYTETIYNDGPWASEILGAIRSGSLKGMSYTGVFVRSDPALAGPFDVYQRDASGNLTLVTRQEIALIEYGPTPIPAFADAAVVGVRNRQADADDRAAVLAQMAERQSITLTGLMPGQTVTVTAAAEPVHDGEGRTAAEPDAAHERADVDHSAWDADKATANALASDDPAAFFRAIMAGEKNVGTAAEAQHWALPYRYTPSSPPNARGVAAALGRLDQTQGLVNTAEARAKLERLSAQIKAADGSGDDGDGRSAEPEGAERSSGLDPATAAGTMETEGHPSARAAAPLEPREHSATATSTSEGEDTNMSDERVLTVEERTARRDEIKDRLQALHVQHGGGELGPEARAEWDGLIAESDANERAISDATSREAQFLQRFQATERNSEAGSAPVQVRAPAGTAAGEAPAATYRTSQGTTDRIGNLWDLTEVRRNAHSMDDLPEMYRNRARRALDMAVIPAAGLHGRSREDMQADIERVLVTRDDKAEFSQRMILTGSPAYMRAFGKLLSNMGERGLTDAESRALSQGTAASWNAGSYPVPYTLDPSVLLTSNGAVNPWRQISRVEQITGKEWLGVTSTGITVSRTSEATESSDNSPTLVQPGVQPTKVQAFVPFSIETEQDWGGLMAEITAMLTDAKDVEEATEFFSGSGTAPHATGILGSAGLSTAVRIKTVATAVTAVGDLYALEAAVPPRYIAGAQWVASRGAYNAFRVLFTANASSAGDGWVRPSQDRPAELLGYPAFEASAMSTGTTTTGQSIAIMGDFKTGFIIVDRIGMDVELIPHLFGGSNRYPTGQRAIFAMWRNSSGLLAENAFRYLSVL
jgi:HK97 family phage major capsid protein